MFGYDISLFIIPYLLCPWWVLAPVLGFSRTVLVSLKSFSTPSHKADKLSLRYSGGSTYGSAPLPNHSCISFHVLKNNVMLWA